MRALVALAVVVVFVALLVIDTGALVRLTAVCVTGGCGVPVIWIAVAAGVMVLALLLSVWRSRGVPKRAKVKRNRPTRARNGARAKRKRAK